MLATVPGRCRPRHFILVIRIRFLLVVIFSSTSTSRGLVENNPNPMLTRGMLRAEEMK